MGISNELGTDIIHSPSTTTRNPISSPSTLRRIAYVSFFLNIWLMLCTYSVGVMPKENLKALLIVPPKFFGQKCLVVSEIVLTFAEDYGIYIRISEAVSDGRLCGDNQRGHTTGVTYSTWLRTIQGLLGYSWRFHEHRRDNGTVCYS